MKNIFRKIFAMNNNVLGINQRNANLVYHYNHRKDFPLADDKVRTKSILEKNGIACAETYQVIERIGDIAMGWEAVQGYEKIAIKPANGSGGGGIKILRKNNKNQWVSSGKGMDKEQVFAHLANIIMGVYSLGGKDRVLIERCIEPSPFFHTIYPKGVPDYRVILLHDVPLLAMLRVPTDKSDGKANLHQGGLGIGIDMKNGCLLQGYDGEYHDNHPDTGAPILGKTIPLWDEIVAISIATSKAFPLNYLGIDIVVDKDLGPLIMEINVRPGLGIQNVNKVGLKQLINQSGLTALA